MSDEKDSKESIIPLKSSDSLHFHVFWFSVLLILMFRLMEAIIHRADPHPSNMWTALAITAAFGFHPASAVSLQEVTNEIYYRADVDKDGTVTDAELAACVRSGSLGPIPAQPVGALPAPAGVGAGSHPR